MTNHITDLLNLKDSDIQIKSISTHGNIKEITLEKRISSHYCPLCNFKMHSLGVYVRTVNHPILQDGFILKLLVRQRRWRCSNPRCRHIITDRFAFLEKRKRSTNMTDLLIVQSFKDASLSASQIAKRFHVGCRHIYAEFFEIFMRKTSNVMRSWSRNLAAKLDSYTHENTTLLRIFNG